eukprot:7646117-Pyramimonas_sp.AAC.1
MQELERMMQQIKHLRDTSVGDLEDMTDEERRRRAADLAMHMMAIMGEDVIGVDDEGQWGTDDEDTDDDQDA